MDVLCFGEKELFTQLLSTYGPHVRPVRKYSDALQIQVDIVLKSIEELVSTMQRYTCIYRILYNINYKPACVPHVTLVLMTTKVNIIQLIINIQIFKTYSKYN